LSAIEPFIFCCYIDCAHELSEPISSQKFFTSKVRANNLLKLLIQYVLGLLGRGRSTILTRELYPFKKLQ